MRIKKGDWDHLFFRKDYQRDVIWQSAAEDLLNTLVLKNGGLRLKQIDVVMTAMSVPILRGLLYVSFVATKYGVEERSAGAHRAASKLYTIQAWLDWYEAVSYTHLTLPTILLV